MSDLKKQAEELGIKVDGRWSDERLQAEIDEMLAKDPVAVDEPSMVDDLPDGPAEPEVEVLAPGVVDPLVAGNAEIQAEIEARAPADGRESDEPTEAVDPADHSITVTNLQVNPMKVLGLASYGSVVFTERQLNADPRLYAKIKRGVELGILKVEG